MADRHDGMQSEDRLKGGRPGATLRVFQGLDGGTFVVEEDASRQLMLTVFAVKLCTLS